MGLTKVCRDPRSSPGWCALLAGEALSAFERSRCRSAGGKARSRIQVVLWLVPGVASRDPLDSASRRLEFGCMSLAEVGVTCGMLVYMERLLRCVLSAVSLSLPPFAACLLFPLSN